MPLLYSGLQPALLLWMPLSLLWSAACPVSLLHLLSSGLQPSLFLCCTCSTLVCSLPCFSVAPALLWSAAYPDSLYAPWFACLLLCCSVCPLLCSLTCCSACPLLCSLSCFSECHHLYSGLQPALLPCVHPAFHVPCPAALHDPCSAPWPAALHAPCSTVCPAALHA